MHSLLIKTSVILFLILAMGGGLTLASTSSQPGMFLYPLKQTTQRVTGTLDRASGNELPAIVIPQNGTDPGSDVPDDGSPADGEDNQLLDADGVSTSEATEPAAPGVPDKDKGTVPATAHAEDQIAATAEPVGHTQPDTTISDNNSSDPGNSQPDASYSDNQNETRPDSNQPEADLRGRQPGDNSDDSSDSDQPADDSNAAQPGNAREDGQRDDSKQHNDGSNDSQDGHSDRESSDDD